MGERVAPCFDARPCRSGALLASSYWALRPTGLLYHYRVGQKMAEPITEGVPGWPVPSETTA